MASQQLNRMAVLALEERNRAFVMMRPTGNFQTHMHSQYETNQADNHNEQHSVLTIELRIGQGALQEPDVTEVLRQLALLGHAINVRFISYDAKKFRAADAFGRVARTAQLSPDNVIALCALPNARHVAFVGVGFAYFALYQMEMRAATLGWTGVEFSFDGFALNGMATAQACTQLAGCLSKMPNLDVVEWLYAGRIDTETLARLMQPPALKELSLRGCSVEQGLLTIPANSPAVSTLVRLKLSEMSLQGLTLPAATALPRLEQLWLARNNLCDASKNALQQVFQQQIVNI